VHDFLFSDPEAFSAPLDKVVESTGLDASSFISCFSKAKFDGDIKRNLKEASALRLPGVPFFFVGDQEYLGAIDREDLERVIEQGL
jgi:protein-disulfide isomerase